jgi:hypothetical protein
MLNKVYIFASQSNNNNLRVKILLKLVTSNADARQKNNNKGRKLHQYSHRTQEILFPDLCFPLASSSGAILKP